VIYPWQQDLWQQLTARVQQESFPHALLLTGQAGLGKVDLALALADYLLCESPQHNACGSCRGCQLRAANSHPDYFVIELQEKSKVIKIDQIRELVESLTQTAHQHRQVVVIKTADKMNVAAANALLKTLEEPQGDVVFILVSDNPGRLPATILSRCQQLAINVKQAEVALSWLRSQDIDQQQADFYFRAADGAPLLALRLSQENYLNLAEQVFAHLLAVRCSNDNALLPLAEWLKEDVTLLLRCVIAVCIDLQKLSQGVSSTELVNQQWLSGYQQLLPSLSRVGLANYYERSIDARQLLLGATHVNVQLLFESLLLAWAELN
jgi:DNA polymerase III subunit delta'